jgi:hypothetical protein
LIVESLYKKQKTPKQQEFYLSKRQSIQAKILSKKQTNLEHM